MQSEEEPEVGIWALKQHIAKIDELELSVGAPEQLLLFDSDLPEQQFLYDGWISHARLAKLLNEVGNEDDANEHLRKAVDYALELGIVSDGSDKELAERVRQLRDRVDKEDKELDQKIVSDRPPKKIASDHPFNDEATPPGSCDVGPSMRSVRRSDASGRQKVATCFEPTATSSPTDLQRSQKLELSKRRRFILDDASNDKMLSSAGQAKSAYAVQRRLTLTARAINYGITLLAFPPTAFPRPSCGCLR